MIKNFDFFFEILVGHTLKKKKDSLKTKSIFACFMAKKMKFKKPIKPCTAGVA